MSEMFGKVGIIEIKVMLIYLPVTFANIHRQCRKILDGLIVHPLYLPPLPMPIFFFYEIRL